MAGIFDYLVWRGDLSFESDPFNRVDSMILCAMSYLPFELIDFYNGITIKDACKALSEVHDIKRKVLFKGDIPLIRDLQSSARFADLKLYQYTNIIDPDSQTQFSAITVRLKRGLNCVVYRGTDSSLVGWKEDFNMSFVFPVPSQVKAKEYFEAVSSKMRGRFILAGHSKGGNLAIYSAALCKKRLRRRIDIIYNYDSPGFDRTFLQSDAYKSICDIINTYIPQESVVGMLLEHEEKYTIVRSRALGILQHDIYSWDVKGKNFIEVDTITDNSRFIDYTLKDWIAGLDYSQREKLIDTIFDIMAKTNAKTFKELGENWLSSAIAILKSLHTLDDDTRKAVFQMLGSLAKCAKNNFKR